MNFDAIPDELKARRQWVVWRSIVSDGKVTKPPYNPNDPARYAEINDPGTWGSYDDAIRVYGNNPSLFSGIGFVFSTEDEYFGIDIDDEAKVKPEHLDQRRALVEEIMMNTTSYAELSPSGKGVHIISKGKLPVAGTKSVAVQVECYQSERYFTFTGDVINGRTTILNEQQIADRFFANFKAQQEVTSVGDTDAMRRLDLTDEEVIRLATNFNPNFAPRFNCQVDCEPGAWSDTFMMVVGVVERFTGSVEQVQRIIFNSPMVLNAPPSGQNESRLDKAKRNFNYVLARVRQNNSGLMQFAEHGRRMVENLNRTKAERAAKAAEAIRNAEETISGMSKGSASLLDAFPQLTTEHKILTRPPGIVGEFVKACEQASYKPFTKFAIPATLSTLAGILSRGYKLAQGSGLNANFILAAPSNAGKTQVMKAWERFLGDATDVLGNSVSGPAASRIVNSSTSSIQAMLHDFMDVPSLVWFVEECHGQLTAMNDGKSNTDAHLRDAFNQLYDAGVHGSFFSGPRSVANRKADFEPVNNLNVSTFWTTTTSKFDIFNEDALDGFLSRVIVIRHDAKGGDPVQYTQPLPDNLKAILVQRLAAAKQLDETYRLSASDAARLITIVSTGEVSDLVWEFIKTVDTIANAAIEKTLPPVYGAISRLPITAQRLAGVLAVMENPYTPSITPEQYKWAFGYLLQNLVALLSDLDTGQLGTGASDETMAVVNAMKHLLKDKRFKHLPGVPKSELREYVKSRKPFHMGIGTASRSQRVTDTFAHMMKEGMIEEVPDLSSQAGRGRPRVLVAPVPGDPIWNA